MWPRRRPAIREKVSYGVEVAERPDWSVAAWVVSGWIALMVDPIVIAGVARNVQVEPG
jgi:hypothetical protein